jgi:uncharacterized membrane protein YqjE
MTDKAPIGNKGLFQSLTSFADTLVAIAHTRLELLSTDFEEERLHVFALLAAMLAALFLIGVGLVLATILCVVLFWDSYRVPVLASFAGFYLIAGLAAGGYVLYRTRTKPSPFSASLSELKKDRQRLSRGP